MIPRVLASTSIIFASAMLVPAVADAGPVRSSAGSAIRGLPMQIAYTYQQDLQKLRTDILSQREQDGGTLSPEHQTAFQSQLDDINKRFHKALRNANPLSIDSSGHRTGIKKADWTQTDLFLTGRQ